MAPNRKSAPRVKSVVAPADADALSRVVAFLNEGSVQHAKGRAEEMGDEDRAELRRLTEAWLEADGHWTRFIEAWLMAGHKPHFTQGTFVLQSGGAAPALIASPPKLDKNEHANGVFLNFVLHPDAWRLGCCERCTTFFLRDKKGNGQRFCSTACQIANGALVGMKKYRARKESERIAEAQAALRKYREMNSTKDWYLFVEYETDGRVKPATLKKWERQKRIKAPKNKGGRSHGDVLARGNVVVRD